jgi:hypothetical protein
MKPQPKKDAVLSPVRLRKAVKDKLQQKADQEKRKLADYIRNKLSELVGEKP